MRKPFSSNSSIDELRWEIMHSCGRKQEGLEKYLSCRDSLENKEAAEQFMRYLTNSGNSYLKRLENAKKIIFEKGYDSFSNSDLSYFSELLGNAGSYVETSVKKKGKQVANAQSVLARISGLRNNLENVLKSREEKERETERIGNLKKDVSKRVNSDFYKHDNIAIIELRAKVRQYQVQEERKEQAEQKLKTGRPYLNFLHRNVGKIKVAAACLVAGVAVAQAPEIKKHIIEHYTPISRVEIPKDKAMEVPLIDVSIVRSEKEQSRSYSAKVVKRNIEVYAPDRVESSVKKEVVYAPDIKSGLVSSGSNLEGKVELSLKQEQKKPGIFSRARDSFYHAGKRMGRAVAGLKKAGGNFMDGMARAYDSGMERMNRINYEKTRKAENEYKLSVVNPAGDVVGRRNSIEASKPNQIADGIHKKYPFVLRITRSEHDAQDNVYFFGKRVKSLCPRRIVQESRGLMAMVKLPERLPEDFESRKEITHVIITDIDIHGKVSGVELTGEQWKERKEYVPPFGSFR